MASPAVVSAALASRPTRGVALAAIVLAAAVGGWTQPARAQTPAELAGTAAVPRELLNSERIAARYGSYGIEVLSSDETLRVSNLFSGAGENAVTRTFAIVRYPRTVAAAFATEHALVLSGKSIGSTFVEHGWQVLKTHLYFGEIGSTERLRRLMGGIGSGPLALHVYELDIAKGRDRFTYATIAEVHHPDYLTLADLIEIYTPGYLGSGGPTVREMFALVADRIR